MTAIERGEGVTASEKYLAALAEKTFLDLWSYPNTFIDKKSGGKGDGKEFADLLVIFDNDIIIFSDKYIEWPPHDDPNVSWQRWYNRAIKKSVDQIRGAERWLQQYPKRIFIDKSCQHPLPIDLPPLDKRRVHGIAVALGAETEARKHWGGDDCWSQYGYTIGQWTAKRLSIEVGVLPEN